MYHYQVIRAIFLKQIPDESVFYVFFRNLSTGKETKRSFSPSGRVEPFSGGVFSLKIKNNSIWANL